MISLLRIAFLALLGVGGTAACSDMTRVTETGHGGEGTALASHSNGSVGRGGNAVAGLRVVQRRNGRTKSYLVRVDEVRQEIRMESESSGEGQIQSFDAASPCGTPSFTCEGTDTEAYQGSFAIHGEDRGYVSTGQVADPGLPVYDPSLGIAEYSTYDSSRFYCPSVWENAEFWWRGHYFETRGYAHLIERLPSRIGVPKGRYQLPPGQWRSSDGRARIYSGTLEGTCFVANFQAYGVLVQGGAIGWYRYSGPFEVTGDDSFAFASRDGTDAGGSADDALETYITEGKCTPGWVIIVDGTRVC